MGDKPGKGEKPNKIKALRKKKGGGKKGKGKGVEEEGGGGRSSRSGCIENFK